MLLAAVTGAAALVPVLAVFPVVSELLKNGAGTAQMAVFISTLTTVGIVTIPLEVKYMGVKAAVLRNLVIFSVGICHILSAGGVIMKHKVIKAEMMGLWKAAAAAYLAVFIFIPGKVRGDRSLRLHGSGAVYMESGSCIPLCGSDGCMD